MSIGDTITTGFVRVSSEPEIRIFYQIDGSLDSSKPTILLSSSLSANIHLWDDFVTAFESSYTIVRYDARFHGQSPLCADQSFDYAKGHSMEDLTDDVLKILDALEITRVDAIIGLSIGAAVGLIFGAKYPSRVRRVVVVGTRATSNAESNANHTSRIKYGYSNGPVALGRQSIARWFDDEWAAAHPEGIAHAEKVYCGTSIQGYEASIAALRVLNLFPYAKLIGEKEDGEKFVLIAGELDGTVPVESEALAEKMGSRVIVIPKSGHITPIQLPDEFHKIAGKILDD